MKKGLLFIISLIGFLNCYSQSDTSAIPFVAYWSVGDSYNFEITKIKKQWRDDELSKSDSSSYTVNFLVIDSTETSYKIRYRYKTNLSQYNLSNQLLEKLHEYQLTEVIYYTSEVGEFVEIENWQEISEMMKNLFAEVVDLMVEDDDADGQKVEEAIKVYVDVFNTQAGIEQLVFKELQYFHMPMGYEYEVADTMFYEEHLPNMIGGDPIRGNGKMYFDYVDFESSFCVFIQELILNPEDTKNALASLFRKMNLDDGEMETALKSASFDVVDKNRYEYYFYPGIPYFIETNRVSEFSLNQEHGKRLDVTRIEMVD